MYEIYLTTCPECDGEGVEAKTPYAFWTHANGACPVCAGDGTVAAYDYDRPRGPSATSR